MANSPSPAKQFTVSIIGGGLGGVLFAIGLFNRSIPFIIYESAQSFTETSAGLGFGPNAVRAMVELDPRIYEAYNTLKTENKLEEKKDTFFDIRLGEKGLTQVAELKMGSLGGGNVLRASFLMELVKLLPDGCATFGKTLVEVEDSRENPVLYFSDGTSICADIVVGCDGIRSQVRESLLGTEESKPTFTGMYLYRGVIEMAVAEAAAGKSIAQNSQVLIGKDGFVVTYPIENGSFLNVVAFKKAKEDNWKHERWVIDSSSEDIQHDFQSFDKKILELLVVCKQSTQKHTTNVSSCSIPKSGQFSTYLLLKLTQSAVALSLVTLPTPVLLMREQEPGWLSRMHLSSLHYSRILALRRGRSCLRHWLRTIKSDVLELRDQCSIVVITGACIR